MARISDCDNWFEEWLGDKQSMLNTMVKNMGADLNAGYNYFGESIVRQRQEIERYKERMDQELEMFKGMDEKAVNRWCFYDMVKRGAIC